MNNFSPKLELLLDLINTEYISPPPLSLFTQSISGLTNPEYLPPKNMELLTDELGGSGWCVETIAVSPEDTVSFPILSVGYTAHNTIQCDTKLFTMGLCQMMMQNWATAHVCMEAINAKFTK